VKGVFLDRDTVDTGDLTLDGLERTLPDWHSFAATSPADLAERIADAAVVVTNKVVLDAKAIADAPQLRLIAVAATGTNNVDVAAANARGVTVCNVRAYATPSVVQHVFALILALTTRLEEYHRAVRDGGWQQSTQFCLLDFPIREIAGRTLGIVGYGELGRAVAQVAKAFGMGVLVAQRPGGEARPDRIPLPTLLESVDILSLHCPLTPATRGLIGAAELARMRPDALLINTARGGIVDEAALADVLRRDQLGGAGCDVLATEPPTTGNPLLAPDIPNLIVTPHVAWASRESRQRLMDQVAENIRAFTAGNPRNVVAG
jgi:glycerate dehydrogenase